MKKITLLSVLAIAGTLTTQGQVSVKELAKIWNAGQQHYDEAMRKVDRDIDNARGRGLDKPWTAVGIIPQPSRAPLPDPGPIYYAPSVPTPASWDVQPPQQVIIHHKIEGSVQVTVWPAYRGTR